MSKTLVRIQLFLVAILLPSLLFLSFPPSIIEGNSSEIKFHRDVLYLMWLLFAALTAALTILLVIMSEVRRALTIRILTCWAVNIIIWNVVFPYIWITTYWQLSLVIVAEIAVFAVCMWIARMIPIFLIMRMAAIFALLNVGLGLYENLLLISQLPSWQKADSPHPAERPSASKSDYSGRFPGNVYHIVLDAFGSDYLTYRLDSDDALSFDGYTFYRKATANYGRTNLSMRSVFKGDLHDKDITKWESAFSNGFNNELSERGIFQYYFPYYPYYCHLDFIICRATSNLYNFYSSRFGMKFVIDIIFHKVMPVFARNLMMASINTVHRSTETWDYGFSLTGWWRLDSDRTADYPKWRRPPQSLTMDTVEDFLETEAQFPRTGRYVYLHIMVPHGPATLDPDCVFVDPKLQAAKTTNQAYQDHYACAVTIIQKITARLKELDRFNDSLVIFHADHGSYVTAHWNTSIKNSDAITLVNRNTGNLEQIPSRQTAAVANILFLVHAPGQTDFRVSEQELQLIDVAPTILDYFGLDRNSYQGVSALSDSPPIDREVIYYESDTNALKKLKRFAKFIRKDGEWRFVSWSPVNQGTSGQTAR